MGVKVKRVRAAVKKTLMRKKGWYGNAAKNWEDAQGWDLKADNGVPEEKKKWAHKKGFLSYRIGQYGLTDDNADSFVSDRDYRWLQPIDNIYEFWLHDRLTFKAVLRSMKDNYCPEYYLGVFWRDGKKLVIGLDDLPSGYDASWEDALRLLEEKKHLLFVPMTMNFQGNTYYLGYENNKYSVNNAAASREHVLDILQNQNHVYCLIENVVPEPKLAKVTGGALSTVQLTVVNEHGNDPKIMDVNLYLGKYKRRDLVYSTAVNPETGSYHGTNYLWNGNLRSRETHYTSKRKIEGTIPNWTAIRNAALETARNLAELELIAMSFAVSEEGVFLMQTRSEPGLPISHVINEEYADYLKRKLAIKRSVKRTPWLTKNDWSSLFWRITVRLLLPPGYLMYEAKSWLKSVWLDFWTFKKTTIKQKIWSYRRGFPSFRIAQYGLNEENWRDYISDRDYHWIRPINNKVLRFWIGDKITFRYIMQPCRQYVAEYYYHLVRRCNEPCVLKMQDCPAEYSADLDGVLQLIRDKGRIAMKQSSGSHGDGFYKLSYENGSYCVNNEPYSEEDLRMLLSTRDCYYHLTEWFVMHEELRKIYPETVNTIRVMAINRDGKTPKIMNAYMRIGSSKTGLTDNVAYGGVFCPVNIEDGHYHDGEQLHNHVITPCPNHPDTGALIDGYVPLWPEVKKMIEDICLIMPELEYLGFDVAITDKGVKVLEVNRHQDLHRAYAYGDEVQAFFKEKIELKKKRMGIKD